MEKKPFRVPEGTMIDGYSHPETGHPMLPEGHVVMLTDEEVAQHRAHGLALVPVPSAGNQSDNDQHFAQYNDDGTLRTEADIIDHDEDGDAPSYVPPQAF